MTSHDTKAVLIVDESLSAGLAANAAAVLTLTLGARFPELVGPDLHDGDGSRHLGITTVPLPILTAEGSHLAGLRQRIRADHSEVTVVDFCDRAQRTRTYDDYAAELASAGAESISYIALAVHGPRKIIQKLTGSLPLLR